MNFVGYFPIALLVCRVVGLVLYLFICSWLYIVYAPFLDLVSVLGFGVFFVLFCCLFVFTWAFLLTSCFDSAHSVFFFFFFYIFFLFGFSQFSHNPFEFSFFSRPDITIKADWAWSITLLTSFFSPASSPEEGTADAEVKVPDPLLWESRAADSSPRFKHGVYHDTALLALLTDKKVAFLITVFRFILIKFSPILVGLKKVSCYE